MRTALLVSLAFATLANPALAQSSSRGLNRWGLPSPDPRAQTTVQRQAVPMRLVAPQGAVGFVNHTRDRVTIYVRIGAEKPLTLEPGASAFVDCAARCDDAHALVLTSAPGGVIERRVELKSGASFGVVASAGVYMLQRE